MNSKRHNSITNIKDPRNRFDIKTLRFIFLFLSGFLLVPAQLVLSDEFFLKCTASYEINRGKLIKPDWETSYLKINLNGLMSSIDDKGIKKTGRTMIRPNFYILTHRDNRNRIKTRFKVNRNYSTYVVNYPQTNRTLIGICQKGRG